ncbi:MAG: fibrobacter succinogenes major paralogous domain-containing protein [Fibromonadaceae bacterium]|nr:fibrobacter succinogenes major paralogous domain-containing protein [Fibromonadaceae bacterium]
MRTQFSKIALAAGIMLAMAFTFSCSSGSGDDNNGGNGGGSCSINGGTVKIGSQTWMAENLNCNVAGSKCGGTDQQTGEDEGHLYTYYPLEDKNTVNCDKYGRLYNWVAAKSACPSGWHLPSDDEWEVLVNFVGGASTAGTKLKATSGWYNDGVDGNGTNESGFSALPSGAGYSDGDFSVFNDDGIRGYWWSASEYNSHDAYLRDMSYSREYVNHYYYDKSSFYSVRCIKD